MKSLSTLFNICTLRAEPEDIEHSENLAIVAFLSYIIVNTIPFYVTGSFSQPLLYSVIYCAGQALTLWLVLKLVDKQSRFIQTATALFGCLTMITLPQILLMALPTLFLISSFFVFWQFYIGTKVLRSAMEIHWLAALFALIGLNLLGAIATAISVPTYVTEIMQLLQIQPAESG